MNASAGSKDLVVEVGRSDLRVHRSDFIDAEVRGRERETIFGRCWLRLEIPSLARVVWKSS